MIFAVNLYLRNRLINHVFCVLIERRHALVSCFMLLALKALGILDGTGIWPGSTGEVRRELLDECSEANSGPWLQPAVPPSPWSRLSSSGSSSGFNPSLLLPRAGFSKGIRPARIADSISQATALQNHQLASTCGTSNLAIVAAGSRNWSWILHRVNYRKSTPLAPVSPLI